MTDQDLEQLSALLDGQLERHEQDRAVLRLAADNLDTLDRLGRYRLIGDVIRGESAVVANEIRARVNEALVDEPTVLAPRARSGRWVRPVAGMAIAASVALAAVVVAPRFLQQPGPFETEPYVVSSPAPDTQTVRSVAANAAPQPVTDANPGHPAATGQWQTLDARMAERLNRLVIEHHEFGGRTGINGPVAHIGLVNYAGR